jgi:hypothetical protein
MNFATLHKLTFGWIVYDMQRVAAPHDIFIGRTWTYMPFSSQ